LTSDITHLCPVQTCTHGKNGARYVGGTAFALANHVQKRHAEEMRPAAAPPAPAPLLPGKRAVIYLRVSTIDQHPENQLPNIRTFCALRGYTVIGGNDASGEPLGLYVDKAGGKNMNRPELQRLLRYSVSGHPPPFDVMVFRRLSRLGRSLRDNIALFDHFQSLGITIMSSEADGVDTSTASGRFVRNVLASVHEYQRENMIEEVREGLERRKAEGKALGRHRTGCGVPTELGGLGPCPDGIAHKVNAADLIALAERRARWRDSTARRRLAKKLRASGVYTGPTAQRADAHDLHALARQTPPQSEGVSGQDNTATQGA
jgi:DNA invertase Pin-like site-specific DNA recombinase